MNTNWVPLWSDVITSSLWRLGRPGESKEMRERGKNAKLLFLTMLAMANQEGMIRSTLGGLSDMARLTDEETKSALELLEGPDQESRNKANSGRRVKVTDGGWVVLNYAWHIERMAVERRKAQMRQASMRYRQKKKDGLPPENKPDLVKQCRANAVASTQRADELQHEIDEQADAARNNGE